MISTSNEVVQLKESEVANWRVTQLNTFTRWVNKQLRCIGLSVDDLKSGFEDGLKLIRLVEVLSDRSLGRYSKKVTFRSQKIENNALALNFLENEEHIKLINIDSASIVDGDLKLIMGLIWSLIVHYTIANQLWELPSSCADEHIAENCSPKEKLMTWIRSKIPADIQLRNFTTDWNSGVVLGALVNACACDLRLNWRKWDGCDALRCIQFAMNIAEKQLGIAQLLTAEELINVHVDEKSVMTYLAQFPQSVNKPMMGVIEEDLREKSPMGQPFTFTLRTVDEHSKLTNIHVYNPNDKSIDTIVSNQSLQIYSIQFLPRIKGRYEVIIELRNSMTNATCDLMVDKIFEESDVCFSYDKMIFVGDKTRFDLMNANEGIAQVAIVNPNGYETVLIMNRGERSYTAEFEPQMNGEYKIDVVWNGVSINGAPFKFIANSRDDVIKIWGRGIVSEGVRVADMVWIYVKVREHVSSPICIHVKGPDGDVPVRDFHDDTTNLWTFCYVPPTKGDYQVDVQISEAAIVHSTYNVHVRDRISSKVRAFGPGLQDGVVRQPCAFSVQTTPSCAHEIGITVRNDDGDEVNVDKCFASEDGFNRFKFTPEKSGIYEVSVMCDGDHIQDSPFVVMVSENVRNITEVNAQIYGWESNDYVVRNGVVSFNVDTRHDKNGIAPTVTILDENFVEIPVRIKARNEGLFGCSFVPNLVGKRYYIIVTIDGIAIPHTPYMICIESEKEKREETRAVELVNKRAFERVESGSDTEFTFSVNESCNAKRVEAKLLRFREDDEWVDVAVVRDDDGTYKAYFMAPEPGSYKLLVCCDDEELSAFDVNVQAATVRDCLAGIQLENFVEENESISLGERKPFTIKKNEGLNVQVVAQYADGSVEIIELSAADDRQPEDGVYTGEWTSKNEGDVTIRLICNDRILKEIPVRVIDRREHNDHTTVDSSKCCAHGDGLQKAVVGQTANFIVDASRAGKGKLEIAIKGPKQTKSTITERSDGSSLVEYVPSTPGLHQIDITFGDADNKHPIDGSPFMVMADYERDISSIKLRDFDGIAVKGSFVSLTVDASQTCADKLEARLPSEFMQQPIVEQIEDTRIYRVTFYVDHDSSGCIPLEIFYGEQSLTKGPLNFRVVSPPSPASALPSYNCGQIHLKSLNGDDFPSELCASRPFTFLVDAVDESIIGKELTVELKGPDGRQRKAALEHLYDDDKYVLRFIPDICGIYSISLFADNEPITGTPYQLHCKPIGDAKKCVIVDMPKEEHWKRGESKCLAIDVGAAGEGVLSVLSIEGEINSDIEQIEDDLFVITLTPLTTGIHRVLFLFGGNEIPDGNIYFECLSLSPQRKEQGQSEVLEQRSAEESLANDVDMKSDSLTNASANESSGHIASRSSQFSIDDENVDVNQMNALVQSPSLECHSAFIEEIRNGCVPINYQPKENGKHKLSVKCSGRDLEGSPMKFNVEGEKESKSAKEWMIHVEGSGIAEAVAGEASEFVINTRDICSENITVFVEGVARAKVISRDEEDGKCRVSWIAPIPGEYLVHVKVNNEDIDGSPYVVVATGPPYKRAYVCVESAMETSFEYCGNESSNLSASVKFPSGITQSCPVQTTESKRAGVQFSPNEVGNYEISVREDGSHIKGSPFIVPVAVDSIGNASKLQVYGDGLTNAICQVNNNITVDTSKAGYGSIYVSVQGRSHVQLTLVDAKDSVYRFCYLPTKLGLYVVSVKFNDQHAPDSPFTVDCIGEGVGFFEETISKSIAQVSVSVPGERTSITLHLPNINMHDLKTTVTQPDGQRYEAIVQSVDDSTCSMQFIPETNGIHIVSVLYRGQHIAGSPFPLTVGSFEEGGAHRARIGGVDHEIANVGEWNSFNVYTREAGQGELNVTVEGPSKTHLKSDDFEDGNVRVGYMMSVPGVYDVTVKFNGEHITDSPFKIYVNDRSSIQIESSNGGVLKAGAECVLNVQLVDASTQQIDATVRSPSHVNVEPVTVLCDGCAGDGCCQIKFTPKESGAHMVELSVNNIKKCEYALNIRMANGVKECDAAMVKVGGINQQKGRDQFRTVKTGQSSTFTISTGSAGHGSLLVIIDGPSKVALIPHKVAHGEYVVYYTAYVPGVYYATIKYSGNHIPGSPFKIFVEGATLIESIERETAVVTIDASSPMRQSVDVTGVKNEFFGLKGDARKVTVEGDGIHSFTPGRQSSFVVNTADAGTSLLMVGILGQNGIVDDIHVKYIGEGRYEVKYILMDDGDAFVFIKYGHTNIDGSPFIAVSS